MDKETLSQYGWVVIVIIVLVIMIALATPFGTYVAKAAKAGVVAFADKTEELFEGNDIDYNAPEFGNVASIDKSETTNYTDEEINNSATLVGVGATNPNYVVAEYSADGKTVTFTANGPDSDGLMKFNPLDNPGIANDDFDEAMAAIKGIETVIICDGVKNIAGCAFACESNLTNVSIAKSVTEIEDYAFVLSGIETIQLNKGLVRIGDGAFYMSSLTSITIPNSVTEMGVGVFMECHNLANVTLSNKLTKISAETFRYCDALASIEIPNGITEIEESAFICDAMTRIKIPASVTSIYSGSIQIASNGVIVCKAGSAAETYANDRSYTVEYY